MTSLGASASIKTDAELKVNLLYERIPVYLSLLLTGILGLIFFTNLELTFVAQTVVKKLENFSLLSIPFFILMGSVMTKGKSANQLIWKDATDELSCLMLEAAVLARSSQPSAGLRVHDRTPRDLLAKAAGVIRSLFSLLFRTIVLHRGDPPAKRSSKGPNLNPFSFFKREQQKNSLKFRSPAGNPGHNFSWLTVNHKFNISLSMKQIMTDTQSDQGLGLINNRIRPERKNKIAVVFMNRPEKKNAFDTSMFEALEKVTRELERDRPRAIVLTGADDRSFCAGFDINLENPMTKEFLDAVNKKDTALAEKLINRMRRAVDGFVGLPVPVIASVNGPAYGRGMELATRRNLQVMDIGAELCFSEVRLGLMPDWGGGACLARLVGPAHAADLILTARVVKADEAVRMGLIDRVSDKGCCLEDAMKPAEQIGRNGPKAISHALAVLRQSRDLPLKEALDKEAETAANLIASGECIHGITAFMEKKAP